LLIAGLATAADLFSVFVGAAKDTVERAAPALEIVHCRRLRRTLRWRLKRVRALPPLRRCRGEARVARLSA